MDAPPIRLPAGVRDFLPEAALRRRLVAEQLLGVLEAWGYARIVTPVFEVADVLERGLGADARAAAIRFVEPGTGEVVALRPDITPQVARLAATRMRDLGRPLRLCYEGTVTRLAGANGQREILQAGVELIDAPGPAGDAEVLAIAAVALEGFGFEAVRLDVGHVAPVAHVLASAPPEVVPRLRAALARKDKAGVAALARRLPRAAGILAQALVGLWGPPGAVLAAARRLRWPREVRVALDEIGDVIVAAVALAGGHVGRRMVGRSVAMTLDLGEVRGFDYYTGIRFAGYATGAPDAVLRGGRYDELMGRYGQPARATGFAVDVEAIAAADHGLAIARPRATLVVGDGPGVPAIAAAVRATGMRVAVERGRRPRDAELVAHLADHHLDSALVVDGRTAYRVHASGDREAIPSRTIAAARGGDGAKLAAHLTGRSP